MKHVIRSKMSAYTGKFWLNLSTSVLLAFNSKLSRPSCRHFWKYSFNFWDDDSSWDKLLKQGPIWYILLLYSQENFLAVTFSHPTRLFYYVKLMNAMHKRSALKTLVNVDQLHAIKGRFFSLIMLLRASKWCTTYQTYLITRVAIICMGSLQFWCWSHGSVLWHH